MQEEDAGILRVEIKTEDFLPDHLLPPPTDGQTAISEKWLRVSVSDSGCGIAPQDLDRIFEPYFTTKAAGEGTGLGLSVVHGIMSKSGGCIDVRSCLGEGTTIDLFFPTMPVNEETKNIQDRIIESGKERLMFVDDEEPLADVGEKMLEKLGYGVEAFTDPEKALEAFRAQPHAYDLVITDKNMPRMNGQRLAASLKAIRPGIPVLISSGYHGKKNPDANAAASDRLRYIHKPLRYADLAHAVREMLDSTAGSEKETGV